MPSLKSFQSGREEMDVNIKDMLSGMSQQKRNAR